MLFLFDKDLVKPIIVNGIIICCFVYNIIYHRMDYNESYNFMYTPCTWKYHKLQYLVFAYNWQEIATRSYLARRRYLVDDAAIADAKARAIAIVAKKLSSTGRTKRFSKTAPKMSTSRSKMKVKHKVPKAGLPIRNDQKPLFPNRLADLATVTTGTLVSYYEPGLMTQPKVRLLKGSSEGWIFYGGKTGAGNSTPIHVPHLPPLLT